MDRNSYKCLGELFIAILGFYMFDKGDILVGIISYFVFGIVYSFSRYMDFRKVFSSTDREKRRGQFLNCILVCLLIGVVLEVVLGILNRFFVYMLGTNNMGLCLYLGGGVIVVDMLVRLFNVYLSFQKSDGFCKGIMRGYGYGSGILFVILFIVLGTCRAKKIAILFMQF